MSNVTVQENELPDELEIPEAVEAAYPEELADCHRAIQQRLPLLIEADKEMTQYLFMALRSRMRADDMEAVYLDGRLPDQEDPAAHGMQPMATGMPAIIAQLRDAVRGAVEDRVLVLPHLDLLTTSSGGLTSEAREVIALLYENPSILFMGFTDPSFDLPPVIESLFPRQVPFVGLRRERICHLVTQQESRKFGQGLPVYQMYKYVSGLNAVRLRRLLPTVDTEDYPEDATLAYNHLRQATLSGDMAIPNVRLDSDIGGYNEVKRKLREEILDLLERKDGEQTAEEIRRIERLVPRGMIFHGPPGTGKTLFAKAMATELGATVIVVSGPELKSKWVGEGEKNIRNIFRQARQSAPSVIVLDELDSILAARSTSSDGGARADSSMVNQLLTEMDGFRADELVFVVGTTNFVEALDQAALRPGRFEFHLEINYPDASARTAIISIYNKKMGLMLTDDAIGYMTRMTNGYTPDTRTPYSGDHLEALCRQIARDRLRADKTDESTRADVDRALDRRAEKPALTEHEREVIATHEAGHAVVSLHCEHAPPVERLSMHSSYSEALGEVHYADHKNKHVLTEQDLNDQLCVLYGGMEAERMLIGFVSVGTAGDVHGATNVATRMATSLGVGDQCVPRSYASSPVESHLGRSSARNVDAAIDGLLTTARDRARKILEDNRDQLETLRDMLLQRGTIDSQRLVEMGLEVDS